MRLWGMVCEARLSHRTYKVGLAAVASFLLLGATVWAALAGPGGQAASARLFFGMYGGYDDPRALEKVAQAGAKGMRVYLEWARLQPREGYDEPSVWAEYGDLLKRLSAAGIAPVVMVGEAPPWAASRPRGPLYPGKGAAYVGFLRRLVETYKDPPYNIKYWELWPEPDAMDVLPPKFAVNPDWNKRRAWGDHGADFAAMLRATYPTIKAADPEAQVLIGALAYDWFGENSPGFNSGGIFNFRFLDDVLQAGGGDYFDIFAFNSYIAFAPGWESHSTGYDIVAKTNYLRQKLAQYGISKPMMVLEVGFWSAGSTVPFLAHTGEIVDMVPSPEAQASYIVKLYVRGLAAGLQGVFWYTFRDYANDPDKRGLIDESLNPKLSYRAFQTMAAKLQGATYAGPVNSGGAEGYAFLTPEGRRVSVLWAGGTLTGSAVAELSVGGAGVAARDIYGNLRAAPAASNGRLALTVGPEPVYMEDAAVRLYLPIVNRRP